MLGALALRMIALERSTMSKSNFLLSFLALSLGVVGCSSETTKAPSDSDVKVGPTAGEVTPDTDWACVDAVYGACDSSNCYGRGCDCADYAVEVCVQR